MVESDPMKGSKKSSEKAIRRSVSIVGALRISRAPKRSWREPKVDVPEALWLRLKPYARLSKHRTD
jgi:hypothetical protein